MKKVLVLAAAMMAAVMSVKAEVGFAYDAGFEIVSSYIWRGQYNGGLSFQPDVEIGYDGEHTSLRIGAWGNIGASDYMFKKGEASYIDLEGNEINPNTKFMPELDIVGSFTACGLSVGFNHYYYCDGTSFFNWKSVADIDSLGSTSTTEVWAGYNFDHFFGVSAYINWYTTVAGNDLVYDDNGDPRRAWSSYLEVGYDYTFENIGLTLGAQVGMSPWASDLYGNEKFACTNVTLKLNKEWEFEHLTLDFFAQGTVNPDGINKDNVLIWKAGDEKLYKQKLSGVVGIGLWF